MRFVLTLCLVVAALPARAQSSECPDGLLLATAPTYQAVVASEDRAEAFLEAYVCALRPSVLGTTADLLRLLALRDSVIEHVSPVLDAWHAEYEGPNWQETFDALFSEADAMALRPIQAEGMIFGLTYGPLPGGVQTVLAPPDLSLAIDLREIEGLTMGSEYPFSDLEAEVDLILVAEEMRTMYPASPYLAQSQEAFSEALLTLASLHSLADDELEMWYAGVATSEFYPWAGDREALKRFVETATDSRYHTPFSAILAAPPVAVADGDLDLLLASRAASREEAAARALAWLDEGIDVVGPIWLGGDDWGVAYRYFPAGDPRLDAAEARAEELGLGVERIQYSAAALMGY